jgi:hypothetical protein
VCLRFSGQVGWLTVVFLEDGKAVVFGSIRVICWFMDTEG